NKTGAKRLVEEHANHRKSGAPVPTDDRILVEAFDRFLIVHSSFGEVVNVTLGDLIEELLARKHLVRFWWTDPYRILYELVADTARLPDPPSLRRGTGTLLSGGRARGDSGPDATPSFIRAGASPLLRVWAFPRRGPDWPDAGPSGMRELQVPPPDRPRLGRVDRARRIREADEEVGPHG